MRPIAKERIELLCHTVNRVANEVPWSGLQEFQWAIEAALIASGLPESWVKAACTREMVVEYQKSFKALGYCLKPDNLGFLEKVLNDG